MLRLALSVALCLVLTATADAAVLTLDKPCYRSSRDPLTGKRQREAVVLTGSGFAPGALVDLTVDGTFQRTVQADPAGAIQATVASPWVPKTRNFGVVATERSGATALVTGRATLFGVDPSPRRGVRSTASRVTLRARGFTGGPTTLYAHYVRERRYVKTVRLGRLTGPCAALTRRIRQLPIDRPRAGSWIIQFDLAPTYLARREPYARLGVTVETVRRR